MSYHSALADLKQSFGEKKLLTPAEIAPYIGKSAAAQAKLRDRGHFPINVRRDMGNRVVMSIYDVARYIGEPPEEVSASQKSRGDTEVHNATRTTSPATPASNRNDASRPYRRPPSLGKTLLALQAQMTAAQDRLDFDRELFSALEALVLLDHSASNKRVGRKPSGQPAKRRRL
jgi:hypothetical protein